MLEFSGDRKTLPLRDILARGRKWLVAIKDLVGDRTLFCFRKNPLSQDNSQKT
jgi:hypothetical protein